jgi:hypothetical protein
VVFSSEDLEARVEEEMQLAMDEWKRHEEILLTMQADLQVCTCIVEMRELVLVFLPRY